MLMAVAFVGGSMRRLEKTRFIPESVSSKSGNRFCVRTRDKKIPRKNEYSVSAPPCKKCPKRRSFRASLQTNSSYDHDMMTCVSIAHVAHAASGWRRVPLRLCLFRNHCLGGDEKRGDRSGILQGRT